MKILGAFYGLPKNIYGKVVYETDQVVKTTPIMENRIKRMTELFEGGKGNELPGVRGTLWAALNSVTEFTDHIRSRVDTDATKLNNVWFGSGSRLKQRAFDVALTLSK